MGKGAQKGTPMLCHPSNTWIAEQPTTSQAEPTTSGIRRKETSNLLWGDLDFSPPDVLRLRVRSG